MPILAEEPDMRGGSFSGVLEEYVEAYLFHAWLQNDAEKSGPSGYIVDFASLPLKVSIEEYIGGLCDLTGEIGRYAVVACGTKRDKKSVQLCLETNKKIYSEVPNVVGKKKNALKVSVEKLERIMYECSLLEMACRKEYVSTLETNTLEGDN
jgi:predicted translin family RNA/ssDNA-binding protein